MTLSYFVAVARLSGHDATRARADLALPASLPHLRDREASHWERQSSSLRRGTSLARRLLLSDRSRSLERALGPRSTQHAQSRLAFAGAQYRCAPGEWSRVLHPCAPLGGDDATLCSLQAATATTCASCQRRMAT